MSDADSTRPSVGQDFSFSSVDDVEAKRAADDVGDDDHRHHREGRIGAEGVAQERNDDEEAAPDDGGEGSDRRAPGLVGAHLLPEQERREREGNARESDVEHDVL